MIVLIWIILIILIVLIIGFVIHALSNFRFRNRDE